MDKRTELRIFLLPLLLFVLMIGMLGYKGHQWDEKNKEHLDALHREVQTLQEETNSRRDELKAVAEDRDRMQNRIDELEKQLEEARNKVNF